MGELSTIESPPPFSLTKWSSRTLDATLSQFSTLRSISVPVVPTFSGLQSYHCYYYYYCLKYVTIIEVNLRYQKSDYLCHLYNLWYFFFLFLTLLTELKFFIEEFSTKFFTDKTLGTPWIYSTFFKFISLEFLGSLFINSTRLLYYLRWIKVLSCINLKSSGSLSWLCIIFFYIIFIIRRNLNWSILLTFYIKPFKGQII